MTIRRWTTVALLLTGVCLAAACKGPEAHRTEADKVAADIIGAKQMNALGRTEPFTIARPEETLRRRLIAAQKLPTSGKASLGAKALARPKHWPEKDLAPYERGTSELVRCMDDNGLVKLTLLDALEVAAANNRGYQSQKESVFRSALSLDLESDEFRSTFAGAMETLFSVDTAPTVTGFENAGSVDWSKRMKAGATLTAGIAIDLVKLMTADRSSSLGITADASISIPLLRGSGTHIVKEALTQAERDVIYEIWSFERYKKTFAVRVASEYLSVLQRMDRIKNAEENYRRLKDSVARERMRAEAGRRTSIDVDRSKQSELTARQRWISAQQAYAARLDSFKNTLGLPTDARIELDRKELDRLVEAARKALTKTRTADGTEAKADDVLAPPSYVEGGPMEMAPDNAIRIALARRLDLKTAHGQVYDAQRAVVIAADALRADLTLGASAAMGESRSLGSADEPNAQLRPSRGSYSAALGLDLPFERTRERNAYRNSYISLQSAIRNVQELEDEIKLEVRDALRSLIETRESYRIQQNAVELAEKRVENTQMLLEAGRIETRELLDAQEDLVAAQDALTDALVSYRVTELGLQRDLSVLEVNEKGLWREYRTRTDDVRTDDAGTDG